MKTESSTLAPPLTSHGLPLGASLFTVFLCTLFGANAVAIKISLTGLGIFTSAGLRFGLAALTLLLWAWLTGKPLAINRLQLGRLVILAALFFIQLSLFYSGLSRTTASHGTLIANILPFVVMILAHYFIPGDAINMKKMLGLVLGFGGVVILFIDGVTLTNTGLTGDLLVLLAVLIWGGHVVYIKKINAGFHPVQISLYPMLMAAPLFLVSGYFFDGQMIRYFDPAIIQSLLYQIFVTASFGIVAWNTMLQKFGATALHSFIFVMPISGVFFGVSLLGEPLTTNLLLSIGLVVAGLLAVNRLGNGRHR
jgi:drug/metabolite transporter (DMT)-like permease